MPDAKKRKRGTSSSSDEDEEAKRQQEEARKRRREEHERRKEERRKQKADEKLQLKLASMAPEERRKYERALELERIEAEVKKRKEATEHLRLEKRRLRELEEKAELERYQQYQAQFKKWSLEEESDDDENTAAPNQQQQNESLGEDTYHLFLKSLDEASGAAPVALNDPRRKTIALSELHQLAAPASTNGASPAPVSGDTPAPEAEEDDESARAFINALLQVKPDDPETAERKRREADAKRRIEWEAKTEESRTQAANNNLQLDFDEADFKERSYRLDKPEVTIKDLKPVDHSKVAYQPFRKDFYVEAAALKALSQTEVQDRRKALDKMKVRGDNVPAPVEKWEQVGLTDAILTALAKFQFRVPFPIQAQAMPVIMSGRDMIGISRTGSGKTLAYILPMLRHVLDQPPLLEMEGPIGWVIVPTHELAMQIQTEATKFCSQLRLNSVAAYGGVPISQHIAECRRGAHILIGTPGRLVDLMVANKGKVVNTQRATMCVLDEADRLFDGGFGPQVTKIVNNMRPDRQTVMFSATFPKQIEAAAKKFLTNPIEVQIGGRCSPSTNVTQFVECFETQEHKWLRLLQLTGEWYEKGLVLIFCETQDEVDELWEAFYSNGYKTDCIMLHGGMDQLDRDLALHDFHMRGKRILIATSVASRGIDVPDLEVVFNYRVPSHFEDYVHRIGRTGRAGKRGTSYTFYMIGSDEHHATWLVRALESSNNQVPAELQQIANAFWEKRQNGLVPYWRPNGGYDGSGYKFNAKEARKKKDEVKRQMAARGLVMDDSDDEASRGSDDGHVDVEMDKQRPVNYTKDGSGELVVHSMSKVEKAQEYAASLSLQIKQQEELAAQNKFTAEVEVNDYPVQARWKVTNREQSAQVTEGFEVTVMVKGVYSARKAPPGERKLYLQIDGPTEADVQGAKRAIIDVLEEETQKTLAATSSLGVGRVRN